MFSAAGVPVTMDSAYGVPAVASVIRQPAQLIASMPFMVYTDTETRDQARDSWQWKLLHDKPCDDCDSFQFFYDLNVSLEATQNAFVQKVKMQISRTRTEVIALIVLDPQRVRVYRDQDGDKAFDIVTGNNETITLDSEDILHIRGFSPNAGAVAGTSLLEVHRDPLGNSIAMQKFEGDYFRNNAVPPFWFTGAKNKQHAKDLIDLHTAEHRGVGQQHRAGGLWGEVDVKSLPISMKDAMFIEAKNIGIEDICRIWRWPRMYMEIGEVREAAIDWNVADNHGMKLYVLPRLRRIERAFAADPDIFFNTTLYGEFLTAAMERGDAKYRFDAYRLGRQGGWITANEVRELENYPPHDGGDELQLTPVGGAPNPGQADEPGKTTSTKAEQLQLEIPVTVQEDAVANA